MNKPLEAALLGAVLLSEGCVTATPSPKIEITQACEEIKILDTRNDVGNRSSTFVVLTDGSNEARCDRGDCIFEKQPSDHLKQCAEDVSLVLANKQCRSGNAYLAKCDYNDGSSDYGCLPAQSSVSINTPLNQCLSKGKFIGLVESQEHQTTYVGCTENRDKYCVHMQYIDEADQVKKISLTSPCDTEGKYTDPQLQSNSEAQLDMIQELQGPESALNARTKCAQVATKLCPADGFVMNSETSAVNWCMMGLSPQDTIKCDGIFMQCISMTLMQIWLQEENKKDYSTQLF